jgi:hypothetical protein
VEDVCTDKKTETHHRIFGFADSYLPCVWSLYPVTPRGDVERVLLFWLFLTIRLECTYHVLKIVSLQKRKELEV